MQLDNSKVQWELNSHPSGCCCCCQTEKKVMKKLSLLNELKWYQVTCLIEGEWYTQRIMKMEDLIIKRWDDSNDINFLFTTTTKRNEIRWWRRIKNNEQRWNEIISINEWIKNLWIQFQRRINFKRRK